MLHYSWPYRFQGADRNVVHSFTQQTLAEEEVLKSGTYR